MNDIGIIILAADDSIHLGRPRQLMNFRDRSLLRGAAETALATRCRPIVVVLGAHAPLLEPQLRGLKVFPIMNPRWKEGMNSSIQSGLGAMAMQAARLPDAVLIMVCDQPLASSAHLNRMIAAHAANPCGIVASQYKDTLGVPALFSRAYYSALVSLSPDQGAKNVIVENARAVQNISFPERAVDIKTEEDSRLLTTLA